MTETQRQLDFDRAAKRMLLRHAELPKRKGVSRSKLKHILRTIDDYDGGRGCWASIKTLAANANANESTVREAIKALKAIGVLATDRKGVGTARIFYSIVWSELALLAPSYKPATKPGVATKPPAATKPSGEQNQSITAADLTRISPDQTRISHDQTRTSPAATETVFETKINLLPQTPNHFKPERSAPWTEAEEEILKVGIQMTKAETIAAWKTRACFSSSAK